MIDILNSKVYEDWLIDSFSKWINNGYRYFSEWSINVDAANRILTFQLNENEKDLWSPDFENRVKTDSYFRSEFSRHFYEYFSKENRIFNLEEIPEKHKVEIWWRVAITETKLFIENSGDVYIAIPLAKWKETYSLWWKLSWAKIITWSQFVKTDRVLSQIRTREKNKLFELQQQYQKELIIKEVSWFEFGDWTVRFQIPGWKYSQIKNVHIERAPSDWAFEVLTTKMYKSYGELLSSFSVDEDIWYDRPIALVRVSDLLENNWWDLRVEKVFYNWWEVEIWEFTDEFRDKFWVDRESKFIKDFTRTPPLDIFIWKLKTLLLQGEFKKIVEDILNNIENETSLRQSQKESSQAWADTEDKVFQELWLEKNKDPVFLKWTKKELLDKVHSQELEPDLKSKLIEYISSIWYDPIEIKLDPDVIYKKNWKVYFLEIKKGANSIKKIQNRNLTLAKFLLGGIENVVYIVENYSWSYVDEFGIKRVWLWDIRDKWLEKFL